MTGADITEATSPLAPWTPRASEDLARGSIGYIHSWEVGSTVDGPGIRMVLWTSGCQMRCVYCHNPDTWKLRNGRLTTTSDLLAEVEKYQRFLNLAKGGLTISGGEPLVQTQFVLRLFRACKRLGIHTALDTNGLLGAKLTDQDLESIDLVLLDLKSWDRATHQQVTGADVTPVLEFARRLSDLGKPVWIRFVLVPGLTDEPSNVEGIAAFAATLHNVERVEVLPFHQMGRYKWEELGLTCPLPDTAPPSAAEMETSVEHFRAHGLPVW